MKKKAPPLPQEPHAPPPPLSGEERREAGKALRNVVARAAHGEWKPAQDRPDPVALLEGTNDGRLAEFIPIRFGRMAHSPFDFFRGAAAVMAADLATTPDTGLHV